MNSVRSIVGFGPNDNSGNIVCPNGYGVSTHTGKVRSFSESNGYEGRFTRPNVRSGSRYGRGVTLIELLAIIAMVGAIAAIAIPSYRGYVDEVKFGVVLKDMLDISVRLERFRAENNGSLPNTLAQIPPPPPPDPWGNPYQYLNIEDATGPGLGKLRKDKNLVPLNTDFDLYSMGKDGDSKGPLTAKASRDDIVRANNGRYIGLASEY